MEAELEAAQRELDALNATLKQQEEVQCNFSAVARGQEEEVQKLQKEFDLQAKHVEALT